MKIVMSSGAADRAFGALLSDPPECVLTAKVADLLLALPKHGPVKVNKLLARSAMHHLSRAA